MDVSIGCVCPGSPHESDTVTLRDVLDFRSAASIRRSLSMADSDDDATRTVEILGLLTEAYLMFGIEAWTLVDEKGKRIPVSHAAIREHLLSHVAEAAVVSDAADELYNPVVLLPLLVRASRSSPPTPTGASTSQKTSSSARRPKPLRPSSTSTTPTGGTETTSSSLDGDSSFSQNSVSAA